MDLDNIKLVHPLVVSVRSYRTDETADGYGQTYRVTDRIPLGPFTVRTSYVALLHVPIVGDVVTEARQFPQVRLIQGGDIRSPSGQVPASPSALG